MAKDPETYAHQEWLGYVQPVGLVVSIPALLSAQAYINKNMAPGHQRFLSCLPRNMNDEFIPEIRDLPEFIQTVLGWESGDLVGCSDGEPLPTSLEVALSEYHETLRPTYAVREFESKDADNPWLLLIQELPKGTGLDEIVQEDSRHWHASPHAKFERLLRETQIPTGLLFNGTHLRLIYAPRGETSGYMTFVVNEMATVAGRSIFAAMHMLLGAERLFSLPEKQRLPAILADSRKYQNVVSTKLAEQVLAALYELLRGFQAADDQRKGELLRDVLAEDPNHVYAGLLTVLMRLVFALYAEDRGLLSNDPLYTNYYSVTGLFERLRADAGRYPDTMDQRYGAWAQLLTLFRLIYDGGSHSEFHIPSRKGYLFDPDRYNFLEGRPWKTPRRLADTVDIPRVSDGVIFRVLSDLLILDGERLSYRTLDVEQIGSVYETIMGFDLHVAQGRAIAIKPTKSHGAPTTINLEALLDIKPPDRVKWLREQTDQQLTGQAATLLKDAKTIEDLLAALDKKIARAVTPNVVSNGAMVLQPSDERRRSGSHYTPRSLTEPIVRTTLRPILESLGESPIPEQILDLKVCDPAMGSGAFLVETCRQLGDELVKAWYAHNCIPQIPPDEDEVLHARRLVAQRCLYGVDKNPMAVDLAKLSLWLATLAKDHSFTFLDHSLRHGDSLVGLTQNQITSLHWQPETQRDLFRDLIVQQVKTVIGYRQKILASRDEISYDQLRQQLSLADGAISLARLTGNLVIAAHFSAGNDKEREKKLNTLTSQLVKSLGPQAEVEDCSPFFTAFADLREGDRPLLPLHWEVEFPEVFGREGGGFDAVVGNPPFLGGTIISTHFGKPYRDFLSSLYEESGNRMDLVAYFFRRSFKLLRRQGCLGLIATNTIGQGDTRDGGLRWIRKNSGCIYAAQKRVKWPGQAQVVVSVVHIVKGTTIVPCTLNGKEVKGITAFLFESGPDSNPPSLYANQGIASAGSKIYAQSFLFADDEPRATPIAELKRLLEQDPVNREVIRPYIGGEEINTNPTHSFHRYVIDFDGMSEEEARRWPKLFEIVESKVPEERKAAPPQVRNIPFWHFFNRREEFYNKARKLDRVLAVSQVTVHLAFAFLDSNIVFSHNVCGFTLPTYSTFSVMQSRVHELWAWFFSSTFEDRLNYRPSDCFETFPFPDCFTANYVLEKVGRDCYQSRADLMVRNGEGLTKTYNRFHDPLDNSLDIVRLRELHSAMDRAVLDAYGWSDLKPTCEFVLDYEENDEEENGSTSRNRRKPWRYRWPDEFRDEVLARLLDLNQQRAEQERLSGRAAEATASDSAKSNTRSRSSTKATDKRGQKQRNEPETLSLFSSIERQKN